jgi:hypothetical protein
VGIAVPRAAAAAAEDGVGFVDEDDAGREFLGQAEDCADHFLAFADVLFVYLGAADFEDGGLGFFGYGFGEECLARAWWAVE